MRYQVVGPQQVGIAGFPGCQYPASPVDQTDNHGVLCAAILGLNMINDTLVFYVGIISCQHDRSVRFPLRPISFSRTNTLLYTHRSSHQDLLILRSNACLDWISSFRKQDATGDKVLCLLYTTYKPRLISISPRGISSRDPSAISLDAAL